jgi:hypothetical protein
LQTLHDGVSASEITRAYARYVEDHRQSLHSNFAKRAAVELLKPGSWVMYTHGLDVIEIYPPKELHTGNTAAFGPDFDFDFDVDGQAFYEEGVVLIEADGYQLINSPLPYSADDSEKMMMRLKRPRPMGRSH